LFFCEAGAGESRNRYGVAGSVVTVGALINAGRNFSSSTFA
jgi:hypothetical protein